MARHPPLRNRRQSAARRDSDTNIVRRWLQSAAARCCGVSVFAHGLILFVMALIVFHEPIDDEVPIASGFATVDDSELQQFTEAEFTLSPPVPRVSLLDRMAVSTAAAKLEFGEPSINRGNSDPSEDGATASDESGIGMKIGANAVSKGNFTAWTVPDDPQPWKDYLVVIQIRLPDDVTRYRKEDLSGLLTGDDGYTTPIGDFKGRGFPQKYYGEFDMQAKQFIIRIPGAAAKVQDKIEVRSKVLKEKHVLFIVF